MFPTSTQRNQWTFSDETVLIQLRIDTNRTFVLFHGANMDVS